GKKGQNARLAAKLTGYKIDIKSETEYNKLLMESGAQKVSSDEGDTDTLHSLAGLDKIFTAEEVADDIAIPTEDTDYTEEYEDDEKILDPEDVEQLISEVETDPEESYDELTKDFQD
ncbi:MAG: transcription termination/antitermination protein NusA, partial [Trichococcus flocculiformis]